MLGKLVWKIELQDSQGGRAGALVHDFKPFDFILMILGRCVSFAYLHFSRRSPRCSQV